jgi:serine/threonine protein kinase
MIDDILRSNELDITDSVCDLTSIFKDIKILSKGGASSTIQLIAKISDAQKTYDIFNRYVEETGKDGVFIKIGFDEKNDNSIDMEKTIYKYLLTLLLNNRTPNIMRFVAGFRCNNFFDFVMEEHKKDTKNKYYDELKNKLLKLSLDSDADLHKAIISVIELGEGMDFDELLEKNTVSYVDFLKIMFQILYTLRQLYLNKVKHNDIHIKNVWINILGRPKRLIYFIDDDRYAIIETRYVVKLYDFDLSTFTIGPLSNTKLIEFCPEFGVCSNDNERFDILVVMYTLYSFHGSDYKYRYINDFVRKIIDGKYLVGSEYKFPGRYCKKKLKDGKIVKPVVCEPDGVIDSEEVYNILQLCTETDVFDTFLYSLQKNGFKRSDLPLTTSGNGEPILDIPLFDFKTNVYVSSDCTQTPLMLATNLEHLAKE